MVIAHICNQRGSFVMSFFVWAEYFEELHHHTEYHCPFSLDQVLRSQFLLKCSWNISKRLLQHCHQFLHLFLEIWAHSLEQNCWPQEMWRHVLLLNHVYFQPIKWQYLDWPMFVHHSTMPIMRWMSRVRLYRIPIVHQQHLCSMNGLQIWNDLGRLCPYRINRNSIIYHFEWKFINKYTHLKGGRKGRRGGG